MTRTILNDAAAPAHDAFVEKKSEFIGDACHVDDLDDALMFVEQVRDMHPKSRHVAYAAIVTDDTGRVMERMSDDGEPSGTAGKPILDVLRANGLTDCVVAVTRYFGGILLGSGGLIRAYSTGASLAVKAARTACIVQCRRYLVRLDYAQLGAFQQLLSACDGAQLDAAFTDHVEVECAVPTGIEGRFTDRVRETFNANVVPEALGLVARPVEER